MRLTSYLLIFFISGILFISTFTNLAFAGDPLKREYRFLMGDPDEDSIPTWEELLVGSDPYNPDSDNDGLPDYWELEYSRWRNTKPNALMNPTDSSDAHLDFDYEPISNTSKWPPKWECDAKFTALESINNLTIIWPSDPDITFTQPVFDEKEPHYDNYEEFYRPYIFTDPDTKDELIRYLHTNPISPDTDGDCLLDPDDLGPLSYPCDRSAQESISNSYDKADTIQINNIEKSEDIYKIGLDINSEPNIFEIVIECTDDKKQSQANKNEILKNIENDGI